MCGESATNCTGIKLHWESARWSTLVFRVLLPHLLCLSMLSWHCIEVVLNVLSLLKGGKGFLPWRWDSYNSLGLDTLGTRRKMSKWQEKRDKTGTWLLVTGLMTPGRSLVNPLHFLELTASADPEYRGLIRCQAMRSHANGRWLFRKEISAAPCFPMNSYQTRLQKDVQFWRLGSTVGDLWLHGYHELRTHRRQIPSEKKNGWYKKQH